jgi:dipeptidyl aminopeptidase/acylaminoacyl peptidase
MSFPLRSLACAALIAALPLLPSAQDRAVAVPAGIRVEGMPPIPQSIADDLARYTQFREAQLLAWHPTKRQVLITTAFGAVPQIHLVDGPGRARTQLTFFAPPGIPKLVSASFDPADPNAFVFQRDPGGTEAASLYRYDVSTGAISLLVDARSHYPPLWSRQGGWLAYDSSERNGKDRDLYIVRASDPQTKRRLAEVQGPWSPEDWSPDGTMLLANEIFSNAETYLWRIDVKTGTKKPITARGSEKALWFNPRFSSDGRAIYAISDRGRDTPRIWRSDLATGEWTPVTGATDIVDVDAGFEISGDGLMMAAVFDRGTTTELQVIDLGTRKPRPLPGIPKGVVSQLRWRPASRELGFSLASLKSPGDVYSIDTSIGTLSRWTTSEATFNPEALPAPEVISVKSADGTPISGILYRPAPRFTGPRPVVVTFHGGPDLRERVRFLGRSNYFLNELGVALLFPNVRGSIGFGRTFEQLDNGMGRAGVIADVGALLDWIATRPELDANRVVFSGASYGGWVALEAGIVYNARIRGIIEGAGITNFVTYMDETDPGRLDNRRREFGDEREPAMREYLLSISPLTRAAELKKPTLIVQPGKDTRVGSSQAQELVKALKANSATVWYLEFEDANHANFPGSNPANDFMIASWMWFMKQFVLN